MRFNLDFIVSVLEQLRPVRKIESNQEFSPNEEKVLRIVKRIVGDYAVKIYDYAVDNIQGVFAQERKYKEIVGSPLQIRLQNLYTTGVLKSFLYIFELLTVDTD